MNEPRTNMPLSAEQSSQKLVQHIKDLTHNFSIELLPKDRRLIARMHTYLEEGTFVYVANPPSAKLDDVIETAAELRKANYNPVPHILARELLGKNHLQRTLEKLRKSNVDHLLLIAGDIASPVGPFENTLEIFETGIIEQYEFKRIGIAGHPESSPHAGPNLLLKALNIKKGFAKDKGLDIYIVTQLSFDPDNLINWSKIIEKNGNDLPIHIGMAGPTELRTLLNYGAKCGVGASLRTLMKKATALANLITIASPDELITSYAKYRADATDCHFVKTHFFAFAGFEKTVLWANAVARGEFELTTDGKGFKINTAN